MVLGCWTTWAAGVPRIEFDQTVYDFGKVTNAQQLKGKFTFRNTGEGLLTVDKPKPSCGCTVAGVKPDKLEQGQSGELEFTLTIPASRGALVKQIYVTSNDPTNARVALTVKADHQPLYESQPQYLNVNMRFDTATNVTVLIKRTDNQELKVTKMEANAKKVVPTLKPKDPAKPQEQAVTLTIEPPGKPQRFSDYVRFYLDGSETPQVSAWVNVKALGEIYWMPEAVVWGVTDPSRFQTNAPTAVNTRRVQVKPSTPGKAFELAKASSSLKEVQVEIVPRAGAYEVVATLTAVPERTITGKLTFETNLAGQPKAEIPMTVYVVRR